MLEIKSRLLDISETTRPNVKLREVHKIILHHAPVENASAVKNRNYINELKYQDDIFCSYHYIIGLNGEIINITPEQELTNNTGILEFDLHSISIALCYSKKNICDRTLASLNTLTDMLIKKYNLEKIYDVIRCYDVINKRSPVFFVDNQYDFFNFKNNE